MVGAEAVNLSEGKSLAGDWVTSKGDGIMIREVDAKAGVVEFRGDEKDAEFAKVRLRKSGDVMFLNLANDDGDFHWMMMKVNDEGNEILLWEADKKKFRDLIAKGIISGVNDVAAKKKEKNHVGNLGALIDDAEGSWVKKMVAGDFGVLVAWDAPLVLRKKVK